MLPRSIHQFIAQIMLWLRSYIQAYERVNPPTRCQVIDIKEGSKQGTSIVVQCVDKPSVFESSPAAIVENESMLERFSKRDVRTITYLAEQAQNKPKYTIIAQLFGGEHTVFRLRVTGTSDYIEKTAQEISMDANLIETLSRADALLVGYVSASEKMINDMSWLLSKKSA